MSASRTQRVSFQNETCQLPEINVSASRTEKCVSEPNVSVQELPEPKVSASRTQRVSEPNVCFQNPTRQLPEPTHQSRSFQNPTCQSRSFQNPTRQWHRAIWSSAAVSSPLTLTLTLFRTTLLPSRVGTGPDIARSPPDLERKPHLSGNSALQPKQKEKKRLPTVCHTEHKNLPDNTQPSDRPEHRSVGTDMKETLSRIPKTDKITLVGAFNAREGKNNQT